MIEGELYYDIFPRKAFNRDPEQITGNFSASLQRLLGTEQNLHQQIPFFLSGTKEPNNNYLSEFAQFVDDQVTSWMISHKKISRILCFCDCCDNPRSFQYYLKYFF